MESILIGFILPMGGLAITTLLVWAALRAEARRRLVSDLPTLSTAGIFIGMVELAGTAQSSAPLASRVARERCVAYTWSVSERWSRQVVEMRTDERGQQQRTTRTESGWVVVASGGERSPFYLVDADGSVRVRPDGADLQTRTFANVTCGPMNPLYALGPSYPVPDSDGVRNITEDGIPLHAPIRVIGYARERSDMVAPEIAKDDAQELFLISVRSERGIVWGYAIASAAYSVTALVVAAGVLWVRDELLGWSASFQNYLLGVAPWLAAVLLIGFGVTAFNSLKGLFQKVQRGRANVDVQLKRRNDLVPNLVRVAEGYAAHEAELFAELAALRASVFASRDPGPLKSTVMLLAERYPALRGDMLFADVQRRLIDTEERIALARAYHQDIATAFNTRLRILPDALIGRLGALKPEPLFELAGYERTVERVALVN